MGEVPREKDRLRIRQSTAEAGKVRGKSCVSAHNSQKAAIQIMQQLTSKLTSDFTKKSYWNKQIQLKKQ